MSMTERQIYRMVLKDYPDILDIKQLCEALHISKKTAYRLICDGAISCMKVGREYRIPKVSLVRLLFGNTAGEAEGSDLDDFDQKINVQHL